MSAPLLSLEHVTACYGNVAALHGVDITVPRGEIVTLIGANGAGKSTLMMTIFGNPRAREGRILFDGHDITALPTHQIARLGIAQSPEGRRIFARMTVEENLRLGGGSPATPINSIPTSSACRLFPRLKGAWPAGRHPVGWRAADVGDRPCIDGPPAAPPPRRALARSRAAHRRQIFDVIRELNAARG